MALHARNIDWPVAHVVVHEVHVLAADLFEYVPEAHAAQTVLIPFWQAEEMYVPGWQIAQVTHEEPVFINPVLHDHIVQLLNVE